MACSNYHFLCSLVILIVNKINTITAAPNPSNTGFRCTLDGTRISEHIRCLQALNFRSSVFDSQSHNGVDNERNFRVDAKSHMLTLKTPALGGLKHSIVTQADSYGSDSVTPESLKAVKRWFLSGPVFSANGNGIDCSGSWSRSNTGRGAIALLEEIKRHRKSTDDFDKEVTAMLQLFPSLTREQAEDGVRVKFSSTTTTTPSPLLTQEKLECEKVGTGKPSKTNAEDFQAVIKEGSKKLVLNEYQDVILVLGNTGAGKTTLTQLLTGSSHKLEAVQNIRNHLIILDDDEKIGLPSVDSKTLIPELVIDKNSSNAFYDCPGFSDNRGINMDIAATMFTKMVIDHVKSVKLLFVVTSTSFRIGYERSDFLRLANHVVELVNDIKKYKNSIALVVTKVENIVNGHFVDDTMIIDTIVEFLQNFKESQTEHLNNPSTLPSDRNRISKIIAFVDILLTKNSATNRYSKLGFSRDPNKCGKLSEMPLVAQVINNLTDLYQNQLEFTFINENDFGYTLKDSTKVAIGEIVSSMNKNIEILTKTLTVDIIKNYNTTTLKNNLNFYEQYEKVSKDYLTVDSMIKKFSNISTVQNFTNTLTQGVAQIGYSVGNTFLTNISTQGLALNFFETVSNKSDLRFSSWTSPLVLLKTELKTWETLFKVLISFYEKHSTYSYQNYKKSNFWETLKADNEIKSQFTFPVYKAKLTEIERLTVKNGPEIICSENGDILTVKCSYVKFGDFIKDNILRVSDCKTPKLIQVYATHTIFIDENLHASGINVAIIAPTWEIIGKVTINLSGRNGNDYTKAKNGEQPGQRGSDGRQGFPGWNSGNFFGVVNVLINGDKLSVFANGGNGGKGEDGGDGAPGKDGKDRTYDTLPSAYHDFNCNRDHVFVHNGCTPIEKSLVYAVVYGHYYFEFFGGEGQSGGDGGNGRIGGVAGLKGNINIIGINSTTSFIKQNSMDGKMGDFGIGGSGGRGGKHGNSLTTRWFITLIMYMSYDDIQTKENNDRSPDGANGQDNLIKNNAQKVDQIENISPMKEIVKFKSFAIQNDDLMNISEDFVTKLNNDNRIIDQQNTRSFVEELIDLEIAFSKVGHKFNFLSYYKSYLNRLTEYTMRSKVTLQNKKLYSHMYATALSKICIFSRVTDSDMVIDTLGYFQIVNENIKKLKEANKNEVVAKYAEDYKSEIDNKIQEGFKFISASLLPAIDQLEIEMNQEIDNLISDVLRFENQTENQLEDLRKKKEKMRTAAFWKGMLSVIKITGAFASFMGLPGAAIGAVVASGSMIGEQFVQSEGSYSSSSALPDGIKNYATNIVDKMKEDKERKVKEYSAFLDIVKAGVNDNEGMLKQLKTDIAKMENDLTKILGSDAEISDMDKVLSLVKSKDELVAKLESTEHQLTESQKLAGKTEEESKNFEEKRAQAIEFLGKSVKAAHAIGTVGLEAYNKIRNSQKSLDWIDQSIEEEKEKLKKIQLYQKNIYNIMIPIVLSMSSDLKNISNNLVGKSLISLDVAKWSVRTSLKDIKLELKRFTEGQNIQENFMHAIEKLDEAMSMLVDIYDRLENYAEKKKFADFMANINSVSLTKVKQNPKVDSAIKRLDLAMQSNIFLIQSEIAKNAFKQWVFPFAHLYIDDSYLNFGNNLDANSLANVLMHQIEAMKENLSKYRTQIISQRE